MNRQDNGYLGQPKDLRGILRLILGGCWQMPVEIHYYDEQGRIGWIFT